MSDTLPIILLVLLVVLLVLGVVGLVRVAALARSRDDEAGILTGIGAET